MKIANKISLSFLITVLILTIIAGTVFYLIAKDSLQKSIYNNLATACCFRSDNIKTYLKMLEISVGQLSQSITLADFLKLSDKEGPQRNDAFETAMKRLARTKEANPAIAEFLLMNKKGLVVAASDKSSIGLNESMDSIFLLGQKETFIKDVYYSETFKEPLMAVSAPILDSQTGELSGVLAARVRLTDLNNITVSEIGMGKTGEIYIVNEYGYMITPSRFDKDVVLKQKVGSEAVIQAQLHKDRAHVLSSDKPVSMYIDYRGELDLGAHEYLPQMRWSVIAEIDAKEAFRPLAKISLIFLAVVLIAPIIAWLLGIFIAMLTTASLRRLRKGIEIVGTGNLDHKIDTGTKDEAGQLSRAFDTMTQHLKESTTSIGSLIVEISERKKTEEALAVSRERLTNVLDSINSLVYVADIDSYELLFINKYGRDIFGDVEGRKCWQAIQKGQKGPCSFCTNDKLVSDTGISTGVCQWEFQNTVNGRWYECRDQAIPWTGKALVRMEIATDITERKKTEEALAHNEEKIHLLLDSTAEAIYGLDMNGNCTFCNKSCLDLLGYKHPDELLGKNMHWQIHAKHPDGTPFPVEGCRIFQAFKKGEGTHVDDEVLWRSDGTSFPAEYWSYPQRHDGVVVGAVVTFMNIAERKRSEERLAYFQKAVESATDAIGMSTPEGKHYYQNEAFTKLFGLSVNEVSGASGSPVSVYVDENVGNEVFDAIMSGDLWHGEVKMLTKDKSEKDILLRAYSVKNNEGKVIALVGIHTDITESKKVDDEIAAARDYTENIIKSMFDTLIVINPDGKIRSINEATALLLGYSEEDLIGKPFGTIVAEEEEEEEEGIPFIGSRLKEFIKEGFIKEYGMTYKTKSGEMIPVSFSGAVMRDKGGELIGIVCIGRDLRERKRSEDKLRESEDLLSKMTTQVPGVVYQFYARPNGEMGFYYISDRSEQTIGLKSDLEGYLERFVALVIPEHRESFIKSIEKSVKESTEWKYEGMLQKPTGEKIWFSGNSTPSQRENEIVFNGLITDITERKRSENALRESEEVYRALFNESRDAMMTVSPDKGFLSGNPEVIKMFGCRDEKDFMFRSPAELSPEYQPGGALSSDKAREMMMLAVEKGSNFFEWTHKRINGQEFPATVLLSRVEKGGKAYLQATVRDITESKQATEALNNSQEQLFQTSKMASLGQLSAGAAHEINNPLAGIVGFTEATLLDLKNERIAPERIAHDLKIILKNAERCKVIISNLLNFARAKELRRQESDINSLTDDALALVEYKTTAQNIKVVKKYEKNPRKVSIDQDQMMQVLINVISNAQNAMPDGGELLVRTGSEDNFALIEVKDTGIGIEKENLLKVFDPFFTTREPGQGVGLGLSISYSIMKRHEGSIEAKSDGKNKGASFIIKIPV